MSNELKPSLRCQCDDLHVAWVTTYDEFPREIRDELLEKITKVWNIRNTPGLAWTKTPPDEKDVGKWFVVRYNIFNCTYLRVGQLNEFSSGLLIQENNSSYLHIDSLNEKYNVTNVEFLGPLLE